jgi:hypothetical protein
LASLAGKGTQASNRRIKAKSLTSKNGTLWAFFRSL